MPARGYHIVGDAKLQGQPLPFHAYYWRRRMILELQAQQRAILGHRQDIMHLQEHLARRVSGLDQVLPLLQQAIDLLDATMGRDADPLGNLSGRRRRAGRLRGSGYKPTIPDAAE